MSAHNFLADYVAQLCRDLPNNHRDNFDYTRFDYEPPEPQISESRLAAAVHKLISRFGLQRVGVTARQIDSAVASLRTHLPRLEWLYTHVADDESRAILVKVLAFRALGHRKVRLPLSTPEFWRNLETVKATASASDKIPANFKGWELSRIDVRALGKPIQVYTLPMGAYMQFVVDQYRCQGPDVTIEPKPGDYIIDGGGCWGDTALLFALKAGPTGRVVTFEFLPSNLDILRRNLALNPELKDRITVMENALWSKSGERMSYDQNGPATQVGTGKPAQSSVETQAIDDLLATQSLPRLDFIKLDIEGAELPTLKGAEQTLRRFKPALAIAVYHSLAEFHTIPTFIDSLNLGYRFCLRHFTIHAEETILFAWANPRDASPRAGVH